MSPDGKTLAEVRSAVGQHALWIRNISTGRELEILPPVSVNYGSLIFSRDGNELNFVREDGDNPSSFNLYSVSVFGGEPRLTLRKVEPAICLSPDGKQAAYTRTSEIASEVHVVTFANGEDSIVQKTPKSSLLPPAWSSNGQSLAWIGSSKDDSTRRAITLLDLRSKGQRELLLPTGIYSDSMPAWLPSGGQLLSVFSRTYSGIRPGDQIGLISAGSGNFRQLTNDTIDHSGLALSADGSRFATLIRQSHSEVGFFDPKGVKSISAAHLPRTLSSLVWSDEDKVLTSDPFLGTLRRDNGTFADIDLVFPAGTHDWVLWDSATPAVCPDGDLILAGIVGGVQQIYLVNSHGLFLRTLVKTLGSGMFCDKENELVYYSDINSKDSSLWAVPLAGGVPRKLMPVPRDAPIVYSADGKFAAYMVDNGGRTTATIINLDRHRGVRDLPLVNHAQNTLPHFTPDGDALAFVEQQKEGFALALQPIDGSEPRILTSRFKDPISDFGWSPSGKTLAVMWEHATSDVLLVKDKSAKPD